MASRIQRELAFLLTGRDVSASRAMDNLNRKITGTQRHAGKAFTNIGRNMERGILIGAGAAAGAIGYAVTKAIDWESAFTGVRKTVDGTTAELEAIGDGLRAMSRELPVTAIELAAIAENAGALGIRKEDILEFTRTVAMLGATTDVTTDMASTALGQLQNVLGLTGADFDNFAAALVDLGNKGASTEAQILEIARRAGGSASLIGVAKDATLGWAAAAANLGMNEELAGTSLQRFFQTALTVTSEGGDALKTLAKTAGMTAKGFKTAFGKDATGALSKFIAGLGKLPKAQRLKVVQSVFGKGTGLTRLIIGLADSFDRNLNPSLQTSADAWRESAAAQAEYEKRAATTESQMTLLRNAVDDAAVTIGTNLLPALSELAREGVSWIDDHQAEIKTFGEDLAEGVKDAVTWLRSLDWDAIGKALGAGADAAKALVGAFTGMPPELQQLLVGGFVVNKATGGVVTDIVGGAAGGLFKGLMLKSLGVTAGVVYVNGGLKTPDGTPGAGGKGGNGKSGKLTPDRITPEDPWQGAIKKFLALLAVALVVNGDTPNDAAAQDVQLSRTIEALRREIAAGKGNQLAPGGKETNAQQLARLLAPALSAAINKTTKDDPTGFRNSAASKKIEQYTGDTRSETIGVRRGVEASKVEQAKSIVAFRSGERTSAMGLSNVTSATRSSAVTTSMSQAIAASRIVSAIAANRPVTIVNVYATGASVRYGSSSGSAGRGSPTPRPGDGGIGGP